MRWGDSCPRRRLRLFEDMRSAELGRGATLSGRREVWMGSLVPVRWLSSDVSMGADDTIPDEVGPAVRSLLRQCFRRLGMTDELLRSDDRL